MPGAGERHVKVRGIARPRALWPRLLALGVIIAAVAGAYVYGRFRGVDRSSAQVEQGGYVGFEPAQIDLGDQLWAQVIPVQATFLNRGPTAVVLESASSSCDCTVVENANIRGSTIPPGGSLTLDVKLDTQKNPGKKARRVELTSATGARYAFVIRVNVEGTWTITPDTVDFGDVVVDDGEDGPVGVVVFESDSDELKGVWAAGVPWLQISTARPEAGRVAISMRVAKSLLMAGQNSASVVVETGCAEKPNAAIYVKARATHELSIVPQQIALIADERQRVECFDRAGARARIVTADAPGGSIQVDVLGDGAIELWNSGGTALAEPVAIRVVDDRGRSRVSQVSAF